MLTLNLNFMYILSSGFYEVSSEECQIPSRRLLRFTDALCLESFSVPSLSLLASASRPQALVSSGDHEDRFNDK